MRKFWNTNLIFILTVTLFSLHCGNNSQSSNSNILKAALFDNPTDLDPRTYSDVASYRIIEQIYEPLVKLDSSGVPRPCLCVGWQMPSDTVYIFQIKKGVQFHDGQPFSAYDVAYTYQSVLNPQLKSPSKNSFEIIDKITVPDSFHLKIKLKRVHAPFLSDIEMGIVPEHLARSHPKALQQHPVGTGPFEFVEWQSDAFIKLKRFAHYRDEPAKVDGVYIKILPESTTRILSLEKGEIDFLLNNFPISFLKRFSENPALKIQKKPGSNYVYLGLNLRNKFLSNLKVRRALAYAIDRRGIINSIMQGIHQPANSLLNPRHWAYNPDVRNYPYNPQKARSLLDAAGFPDPDGPTGEKMRFTLNYKCTDKQMSRQKAQIIQDFLKKVGIAIHIQSYEWGTFFEDIQAGRFDMFSLTWVGVYEPDLYYRLFHSDNIDVGANRGAYKNAEVDKLIELAQRTTDLQQRKKYYYRIQEIIADELPYISLWYETNILVTRKRVHGFRIYPAAEWLSFKNIYFQ